ncbi:MAG: MFS transporter [Gammaproteobacteria bacterium]|nr:MFS transporter [Gammaproteobacteria bacterium]
MELKQTACCPCPNITVLLPWLVCLSASSFFFYEFIQGNMFASIADNIMQDFHIGVENMAYLSSIYYVSNVLFLFIAGQVLDRYSVKKILIVAMGFCVISTFVLAQAHSFYVALGCRFITGIGSAFCLLGPVRVASRWFAPQQMAMVTGMIVTIAMLGGMVSQYPLTMLVITVGWRQAVMVVAWVGMVMWGIMAIGIIDQPKDNQAEPVQHLSFLATMKQAYANVQMLRVALFTSLMNMAIAVFGAMMGTLYLMQRLDIGKELASSINGMLFLGTMIGGPLLGRWSDRSGQRLLPMRVGMLGALLVSLAILYAPVPIWAMYGLFLLLGLFTSAQVISYAYVAESQPRHMTATAVSIVSICTQAGCVVFQNAYSHVLVWHQHVQQTHAMVYTFSDYQFASVMIPLGLMVAGLLMLGLKETYCHQIEG